MFKLTSLNLNGIRSAASKGVEAWIAKTRPDCICLQEVKAQAADVEGRFEEMAGLKGYFHFAEKKGYSGVAVYTRHRPSDVIVGYGSPEFDAEGRYLELRFDTPSRKLSRTTTRQVPPSRRNARSCNSAQTCALERHTRSRTRSRT